MQNTTNTTTNNGKVNTTKKTTNNKNTTKAVQPPKTIAIDLTATYNLKNALTCATTAQALAQSVANAVNNGASGISPIYNALAHRPTSPHTNNVAKFTSLGSSITLRTVLTALNIATFAHTAHGTQSKAGNAYTVTRSAVQSVNTQVNAHASAQQAQQALKQAQQAIQASTTVAQPKAPTQPKVSNAFTLP